MSVKLLLFMISIIGCTTQACISEGESDGPVVNVGDQLPNFSVSLFDGTIVSNNTLRGKTGMIVFFNTECSDCQKELPVVEQLWQQYKDNPEIQIVAIAREESAEEIETYWNEHNLTIPFSPQDNRDVFHLFAASGIPRIFVSNPEGIITSTFSDVLLPTLTQLDEAIRNSSN